MTFFEDLAIKIGESTTDTLVPIFMKLPTEDAVMKLAEVVITGVAAQAAGSIGRQRGETVDSIKNDTKSVILDVLDRVRENFVKLMDSAEDEAA